jgi:16S rRNA processing protein RimM
LKTVIVNQKSYDVENVWMHGDQLILKFKGVDTISDAERLAGADVEIPFEQRAEAQDGEYYQTDLIGCQVVDSQGRLIGTVTGWLETGGPPLVETTTPDGKELLIPFAKAIFNRIDIVQKRIEVVLPDGLMTLN